MTAKLFAKAVGVAALLYLATGLYVVGGNEQALVVRFGKAQPELMTSGLHVDLPWPWTRVHRLRPQEMRTLVVGSTMSESESGDLRPFLKVIESQRLGDFFTGDKNVLHVQVHVQYRVVDAPRFLFDSESPEEGLRRLTEAALTETAAQCGVDFLHPLGAHERVIREILLERARPVAEDLWGLRIEDVTVTSVLPPLEVKSAFLDVSNARAERERIIHAEQTKAEQRVAQARAKRQQILDAAESDKHGRIRAAQGSADRFAAIVRQFRTPTDGKPVDYAAARELTMRRMFAAFVETSLSTVSRQIVLDPTKSVDITILPSSKPAGSTTDTPQEK